MPTTKEAALLKLNGQVLLLEKLRDGLLDAALQVLSAELNYAERANTPPYPLTEADVSNLVDIVRERGRDCDGQFNTFQSAVNAIENQHKFSIEQAVVDYLDAVGEEQDSE